MHEVMLPRQPKRMGRWMAGSLALMIVLGLGAEHLYVARQAAQECAVVKATIVEEVDALIDGRHRLTRYEQDYQSDRWRQLLQACAP